MPLPVWSVIPNTRAHHEKTAVLFIHLLTALLLAACNKNTDEPVPAPAAPTGVTYTTLRQGTVVAQCGVSSGGTVAVAKGSDGNEYVQFKADFHSDFHTGSLGIYLAKSDDLVKNQRSANPASVCCGWVPSRSRACRNWP